MVTERDERTVPFLVEDLFLRAVLDDEFFTVDFVVRFFFAAI